MSVISLVWKAEGDPEIGPAHRLTLSKLAPFGQAQQSTWNDQSIALGGTFSDWLPEDRFDTQPIWNSNRSACLIADVRLDNRADLISKLQISNASEVGDSSLLMAAWLRWGDTCLEHIAGAFAFAIWQPRTQEIFAARDHTGERPLFFHRSNGLFALASLPKALLAIPGVSCTLDENAIASWLVNTVLDPAPTLFVSIQRLQPGHYLRVTRDSLECRQYWHPSNAKPTRYKRDEDYAEALVEILDEATEARLRSIRAVGSFLSGGLDSSSVTASAAVVLQKQNKSLTAFTAVPRPAFTGAADPTRLPNEGHAAAEIAALYPNIRHKLIHSAGYDLIPTMQSWTDAMDEPPANIVNLLWFTAILNRGAEERIGVMLEGVGGNITISWHTWTVLGYLFNRGRWPALVRTINALHKRGAVSMKTAIRYTTRSLVPHVVNRRLLSYAWVDRDLPLLNPDWMRRFHIREKIFDTLYNRPTDLAAERSLPFAHYDLGPLRVASEILTGIELRDPTADKRVYEYCFSIPPEQYVAGGLTRSLARRAAKDRLPDSVRLRESRGLQGADWHIPMTESLPSLRHEFSLIEQSPIAQEALDLRAIRELLYNWPSGGFHTPEVYSRYHYALAPAMSLGYFLRTHDGSRANAVTAAHTTSVPQSAV